MKEPENYGLTTLMDMHPNATSLELKAMMKSQDDKMAKYEAFRDKSRIEYVAHLNSGGASYFKGVFGSDQSYYHRVYNAILENGEIYVDVESITMFTKYCHGYSEPIKFEIKERELASKYGFFYESSMEDEISAQDFIDAKEDLMLGLRMHGNHKHVKKDWQTTSEHFEFKVTADRYYEVSYEDEKLRVNSLAELTGAITDRLLDGKPDASRSDVVIKRVIVYSEVV